jgi:SAM-dependent methyltransferase
MTPTLRAARARRALARQLDYQRRKAASLANLDVARIEDGLRQSTARLRAKLEAVRPLAATDRLLEVGSGAHGHVFFLGHARAVGVDPLAAHYRRLFPQWQSRALTLAGHGERLPFADASFDVVVSDNVVDHAESPRAIVEEIARVLRPNGLLYFTVNVHHRAYHWLSLLQGAALALRLPWEVAAFTDHTVHLTPEDAPRLFARLPLRVLSSHTDVAATLAAARRQRPRHAADRLKRHLFKNATYELVALKELR